MEDAAADQNACHREKLQRLHSLLFGAEISLSNGEIETSLGLALRLLGFLLGECQTAEDEVRLRPLIRQTYQRIDAAQQATLVDSQVMELARCNEGFTFRRTKSIDLKQIQSSKYYRPFVSEEKSADGRPAQNALSRVEARESEAEKPVVDPVRPRKPLMQSRLVTLGGSTKLEYSTKAISRDLEKKPSQLPSNEGFKPASAWSSLDGYNGFTRTRPYSVRQGKPEDSSVPNVIPLDDEEEDVIANYRANRKRGRELLRRDMVKAVAKDENSDDEEVEPPLKNFMIANQKLGLEVTQKRTSPQGAGTGTVTYQASGVKTLGLNRRGARSAFVPPFRSSAATGGGGSGMCRQAATGDGCNDDSTRQCLELLAGPDGELPERLRNLEPKLIEHISNEIMTKNPNVHWDDIAGLEHAKKCVTEMVIWPLKRPDLFQGCRSPGKGLLLFGPPGTGKTMIGKAIAGEANATFFSISASSLTSKWIGEGEKLVRALFGVASCRQPAVIFIDEIDSLLSQRKADGEHESSRRLKTQFLIEMEGCGSGLEQILLIGATNRPQELDEAARRRLSKRLYIPLPSASARGWIVRSLLQKDQLFTLSDEEIEIICSRTEGYSGSDMTNLVKEASMGPLREALHQGDISHLSTDQMRQITMEDFTSALQQVRPSVSPSELGQYEDWNRLFGGMT